MMKKNGVTVLLFMLMLNPFAFAEGKIVKWVDKNGVTQYGDKPPMPQAASKASELNKEGLIVKQIDQSRKVTDSESDMEQSRKDAALLASYSSEEEIDIAQERNTRIDQIAIDTLRNKQNDLNKKLEKNMAAQALHTKKKIAVPEAIKEEHRAIIADINAAEQEIASRETAIENTKQRYQQDKARYITLKAQGASYRGLVSRETKSK